MSARQIPAEGMSLRHVGPEQDALTLARVEVGDHDVVLVSGLPIALDGAA